MQLQRDDPSTAHRPGKKFFRTSRSKRKNAENFFGARSLDIAGDNRRPEVIRPRGLGAIETGVAGKPGLGGAGVAMAAGVHCFAGGMPFQSGITLACPFAWMLEKLGAKPGSGFR